MTHDAADAFMFYACATGEGLTWRPVWRELVSPTAHALVRRLGGAARPARSRAAAVREDGRELITFGYVRGPALRWHVETWRLAAEAVNTRSA